MLLNYITCSKETKLKKNNKNVKKKTQKEYVQKSFLKKGRTQCGMKW